MPGICRNAYGILLLPEKTSDIEEVVSFVLVLFSFVVIAGSIVAITIDAAKFV